MHYAHILWMDMQHFQAKILQIKQIWHISQAKVYMQVGRYAYVAKIASAHDTLFL